METYTLPPGVNPFAVNNYINNNNNYYYYYSNTNYYYNYSNNNNNNNKVMSCDISLFLLRVKLAITYSSFLHPRTGLFCSKTNDEYNSIVSKYLKSIHAELPCKSQ